MSKKLLTYSEFKDRADFTDNVSDDRFDKYERIAEETYLKDLIGADLVTSIKAGTYDELLPQVKNCLAHRVELYFIETASVIVTGLGAVTRDSTYSKDANENPQFAVIQNKIKMVKTILSSYEADLRKTLYDGDYTDYNENTEVTQAQFFKITSIGE